MINFSFLHLVWAPNLISVVRQWWCESQTGSSAARCCRFVKLKINEPFLCQLRRRQPRFQDIDSWRHLPLRLPTSACVRGHAHCCPPLDMNGTARVPVGPVQWVCVNTRIRHTFLLALQLLPFKVKSMQNNNKIKYNNNNNNSSNNKQNNSNNRTTKPKKKM